jgi:hypothetical protein
MLLDKTLLDETSLEKTLLDKTSLDETSLDKTSLDKTLLDETSLDETSLDKTLLDETLLDETSLDETALYLKSCPHRRYHHSIILSVTVGDVRYVDALQNRWNNFLNFHMYPSNMNPILLLHLQLQR